MFHTLQQQVGAALMARLTLVVNHVLASESAATQRLQRHAGRRVQLVLNDVPALLPIRSPLVFLITPAGGVEWCTSNTDAAADLVVSFDASNPARTVAQGLSGERPRVSVSGDAELAADVSWLFDNLRWDVQDDLAPLVGPGPAHEMARIGKRLLSGLHDAVRALTALANKARSAAGAGPAGPAQR